MRLRSWIALIMVMGWMSGLAQPQVQRPAIRAATPPTANLEENYRFILQVDGAKPPFTWALAGGALPAGLALEPTSGTIAGIPRESGTFRFVVKLTDFNGITATRALALTVPEGIAVRWMTPPAVTGGKILGAVEIRNQTARQFSLTFIAVAVNGVGKAFTLGYQHADLLPGRLDLDFGAIMTLPAGSYVVHVDAVGELPPASIYRAHLQTGGTLAVVGQ